MLASRRKALKRMAGIAAIPVLGFRQRLCADETSKNTGLGLVIYDCRHRRELVLQRSPKVDLFEPFTFLKHCVKLGAGGMQISLQKLDQREAEQLRLAAAENQIFIDAIVSPPFEQDELSRFESHMEIAARAGAKAVRTVIMPGRRYERFKTLDEFRHYETRGRVALERAVPVVEKHRVPLAVENHKDQRIDERIGLLERISSEFVGACVDTGNSFALLDDPYESIRALGPWAKCVHLKDQALQLYDDGFLLADIPLGEGSFDLKKMVAILRKAKPEIHFALELITRDPLKVPCLAAHYWETMSDVAATDLARALRFVRNHTVEPLQQVSALELQQRVELEDENVARSLRYAKHELGI